MVYLNFLLDNERIRVRFLEVQKHTDPTYPDPEHWMKYDSFAAFKRTTEENEVEKLIAQQLTVQADDIANYMK
jgi:hypothetical protein